MITNDYKVNDRVSVIANAIVYIGVIERIVTRSEKLNPDEVVTYYGSKWKVGEEWELVPEKQIKLWQQNTVADRLIVRKNDSGYLVLPIPYDGRHPRYQLTVLG